MIRTLQMKRVQKEHLSPMTIFNNNLKLLYSTPPSSARSRGVIL